MVKAATKSKKQYAVKDAYAEVTARLLAEMEQGKLPWHKPWQAEAGPMLGCPENGVSGRGYNGINVLTLWMGAWCSKRWFSYRQAQGLGGQVRRGEKGSSILFFKMLETEDRATGEAKNIPMAKLSAVFNEEQIDWAEGAPEVGEPAVYPEVSLLVEKSGATFLSGGARAYFNVTEDHIRLPAFDAFESEERYFATALHELVHWTGHESRLGREMAGGPETEAYAFEELVAEMGAAFLCARLGVPSIDRHAGAYLKYWMAVGRQDKRAFARAASLAQKAADYLLELAA